MAPIAQTDIPRSLNGYPVKAFSLSGRADRALVLVDRGGDFLPFVAATWWPEIGDRWEWGNYFASFAEADAYRGEWLRTYAPAAAQ